MQFQDFFYFMCKALNIHYWQDPIEILILSIPIYYFLIFLKKDNQKNLIIYFYTYCSIFFLAYYIPFYTLQPILIYTLPLVILFFIIIHQDSIQKNLIVAKKLNNINPPLSQWQNELAKCALYALNKNQEIVFVIEQESNLENLIFGPCKFNADLSKEIFEIILQKHMSSTRTFILLNNSGQLISINNNWKQDIFENLQVQGIKNIKNYKEFNWQEKALLITSKTDCIIFKINPLTRNFDLILEGKIVSNLNAENIFKILNKCIKSTIKNKLHNKLSEKINLHKDQKKTTGADIKI